MLPILYPYKITSSSAKKLAQVLSCKRVYPDRNYKTKRHHLVVNWGNSVQPRWMNTITTIINQPCHVQNAANKLFTFAILKSEGVSIPDFTTKKEEAIQWIEQEHKVFCRKSLTSHSGQDIIIATTVDNLVDAPLYVKAIKKDKEYRIHVFKSKIIDAQQKKKRNGFEGGISGIRNHTNGWVFAREGVIIPAHILEESIKAVKALNLDFGAVDICTEKCTEKAFVFEINTAPGLENTTLVKYSEAIKYELENRR